VTLAHELRENEQVLTMRFTSSSELMVLFRNGRVSSYSIKEGKLRKAKGNLKVLLEDDQTLKNGEICTFNA
jgi:tRNA A58 N-methylase Trm61